MGTYSRAAPFQTRMPDPSDRRRGVLLGLLIGDALGTPIDRMSHQNVRTYYRGIRGFRDDEKRGDRRAGEGTFRGVQAVALARALATGRGADDPTGLAGTVRRELGGSELPRWDAAFRDRPVAALAAAAGPLGAAGLGPDALLEALRAVGEALGYRHPAAWAAAFGQATAVHLLLGADAEALDGPAFVQDVAEAVARAETRYGADDAVSARLAGLAPHLDEFPLDLQDRCRGTGPAADEAWPFAVAMAARNPMLVEATLLAAVNVGGDAPTVGACVGALLGALHGSGAFPEAWRDGLRVGALP